MVLKPIIIIIKSALRTKLNGCVGYVVPVLTSASQAWYPRKTNEGPATRTEKSDSWILNGQKQYEERLVELKPLHL